MSPFGYNETVAQQNYPLAQKEIQQRGYTWYAEEEKKY